MRKTIAAVATAVGLVIAPAALADAGGSPAQTAKVACLRAPQFEKAAAAKEWQISRELEDTDTAKVRRLLAASQAPDGMLRSVAKAYLYRSDKVPFSKWAIYLPVDKDGCVMDDTGAPALNFGGVGMAGAGRMGAWPYKIFNALRVGVGLAPVPEEPTGIEL